MNRKSWYHGTKLDFTSSTSLNILRSMLIHKININLNVNLVAYFVFFDWSPQKSITTQYSTFFKTQFWKYHTNRIGISESTSLAFLASSGAAGAGSTLGEPSGWAWPSSPLTPPQSVGTATEFRPVAVPYQCRCWHWKLGYQTVTRWTWGWR